MLLKMWMNLEDMMDTTHVMLVMTGMVDHLGRSLLVSFSSLSVSILDKYFVLVDSAKFQEKLRKMVTFDDNLYVVMQKEKRQVGTFFFLVILPGCVEDQNPAIFSQSHRPLLTVCDINRLKCVRKVSNCDKTVPHLKSKQLLLKFDDPYTSNMERYSKQESIFQTMDSDSI